MLDNKNYTPKHLSIYVSVIISSLNALAFYWITNSVLHCGIAFVATLSISFILINYVLEWFIYRKIKLIYKFIYQTKATKRQEMYHQFILPKKGIEEVREEAETWAIQYGSELEKLKANAEYRKEFLQNLSHEFKTPVFSIQSYLEALQDGAIEDVDVSFKFLDKAMNNVQRLSNLVNDLDEIISLESGMQPLYKEFFIIQDLIKEVFDSLSIQADQRNIKCYIKKGCEYPSIQVFADRKKIFQVLVNLVTNAIKYGRDEGFVSAGVYATDDRTVLVEISDNGIGIIEEHLPRVFERFYRTDKGRSRNVGGTGLGLAICKHIIEAHQQDIHVRSKIDVGTTFGFTLSSKKG